jgi:hypothetical protein
MNYKLGLATLALGLLASCSSVKDSHSSFSSLKGYLPKPTKLGSIFSSKTSSSIEDSNLSKSKNSTLEKKSTQKQMQRNVTYLDKQIFDEQISKQQTASFIQTQTRGDVHSNSQSQSVLSSLESNDLESQTLEYILRTGNQAKVPFAFKKIELLEGLFPYVVSHLHSQEIKSYPYRLGLSDLYGIFSSEFAPIVRHTSKHSLGEKGAFPLDAEMARIWKLYDGVDSATYISQLSYNPVFNAQEAIEYLHELYNMSRARQLFEKAPRKTHGEILLGIIRGDIKIPSSDATTYSKNYYRVLRGEPMQMSGLSTVEAANRYKNFYQGISLVSDGKLGQFATVSPSGFNLRKL